MLLEELFSLFQKSHLYAFRRTVFALLGVKVSGTNYKVGAVVHCGFIHLLPSFSVIKKLVVVDALQNSNSCFKKKITCFKQEIA